MIINIDYVALFVSTHLILISTYPYFTDEKTEAWRCWVTLLKLETSKWQSWDSNTRSLIVTQSVLISTRL